MRSALIQWHYLLICHTYKSFGQEIIINKKQTSKREIYKKIWRSNFLLFNAVIKLFSYIYCKLFLVYFNI